MVSIDCAWTEDWGGGGGEVEVMFLPRRLHDQGLTDDLFSQMSVDLQVLEHQAGYLFGEVHLLSAKSRHLEVNQHNDQFTHQACFVAEPQR